MTDKLDINIRIGKATMAITTKRDEEQLLRQVAKEVNQVYDAYTKRFPKSSESEVLAKVALLFAKGYLSMTSQIEELDGLLDDFDKSLDQMLMPKE